MFTINLYTHHNKIRISNIHNVRDAQRNAYIHIILVYELMLLITKNEHKFLSIFSNFNSSRGYNYYWLCSPLINIPLVVLYSQISKCHIITFQHGGAIRGLPISTTGVTIITRVSAGYNNIRFRCTILGSHSLLQFFVVIIMVIKMSTPADDTLDNTFSPLLNAHKFRNSLTMNENTFWMINRIFKLS